MARSTHGQPIIVRCEEWDEDESVMLRSIQTAGDTKWINSRSTVAEVDPNAPDGVRASMDPTLYMLCVIAKMTVRWSLKTDQVDKFGNPMYDSEGKPMQVSLGLPKDPDERLLVIETLHEDDMHHIFNEYNQAKKPPMKKEEQDDFLPSAKESTETNSEKEKLLLMKS